jgi:hypothetical protein
MNTNRASCSYYVLLKNKYAANAIKINENIFLKLAVETCSKRCGPI